MSRRPLRILLTNHQLGEPGGTEVNVRDWAIGLLRRGHRPFAYAPVLGLTADVLRERGILVIDDLSLVTEPPDIVHGTHTPTVLEAIVRFPQVPVIQTCQGVGYPMSEPLRLQQVLRYVAVDEVNRDYLVTEGGVAPERVCVIHNAIDLSRIPVRQRPLPARPERALIFTKTQSQVPLIEEACRRAGITVDTLGRGVGRMVLDPERDLVTYDLIFATARSAMEAIAAGAATVVADGRGLAGMVTPENVDHLRTHNFGLRSLTHEVTLDRLAIEIERYDPSSAATVTERLRIGADLEPQLDAFEALYADVLDEAKAMSFSESELINRLAPVLHRWLPRFPGRDWAWQFEKAELLARVEQLDATLASERKQALQQASLQASLQASVASEREQALQQALIASQDEQERRAAALAGEMQQMLRDTSIPSYLRARLRRHPRLHAALSTTIGPIVRRWKGK